MSLTRIFITQIHFFSKEKIQIHIFIINYWELIAVIPSFLHFCFRVYKLQIHFYTYIALYISLYIDLSILMNIMHCILKHKIILIENYYCFHLERSISLFYSKIFQIHLHFEYILNLQMKYLTNDFKDYMFVLSKDLYRIFADVTFCIGLQTVINSLKRRDYIANQLNLTYT